MSFIRPKKIKGSQYAYLVENKWTAKGPRQKVTKYIGKIIEGPQRSDTPFPAVDLGRISYPDALRALLEWNLLSLGFSCGGTLYRLGDITVDLLTFTVKNKTGKDAIIRLKVKEDPGYLCTITLQNLLNFTINGTEEKVGYSFARAFVDGGILVPQEVFVRVFEKIFRSE